MMIQRASRFLRDRMGEQVWSKEMVDHETPGNCLSEFEVHLSVNDIFSTV